MKTEIIPAILPRDFGELEEKVSLIKDLVRMVQVDICDGQFVPNATWPYRKKDRSFEMILSEEMGLPEWEKVNFEFDLMVNEPESIVEDWIRAGASRIVLHVESRGDLKKAISLIGGQVEIGLAMNIDTGDDSISTYIKDIQFIQLMGIDRIGFQGQEFDQRVLEKAASLKEKYPDLPISIDGGVSLDIVGDLIAAGASRLIIGSAIFDSDNPFEEVRKFKERSVCKSDSGAKIVQ